MRIQETKIMRIHADADADADADPQHWLKDNFFNREAAVKYRVVTNLS